MSGKAVLFFLEQAGVGGLTIPETSQQSPTKFSFKVRRSRLSHRIVWVGSNLKYQILPAPHHWQGCLLLHQAAQTLFESPLKHFQGWGIHNISDQRDCVFSTFEKKAVICPASEASEPLQAVISPALHRSTTTTNTEHREQLYVPAGVFPCRCITGMDCPVHIHAYNTGSNLLWG